MAKDKVCFLVDDDEDDREIFEIALKQIDNAFSCVISINGNDALNKMQSNEGFTPDYIFLDLNMPVLNGKKCLSELRKIPRLLDTPVIIYSTSSYSKDIEETKMLGATHFLTKPTNINKLSTVIGAILHGDKLPFLLNNMVN